MRFPEYQNSWETLKLRDISEKVNEKNTNNDLDLVLKTNLIKNDRAGLNFHENLKEFINEYKS